MYHAINTQVNPVAAGALTGGLFKAGAGVRGAALASAIGAGLAAASHFELLHLERLYLSYTQVTDAGCATLAAALDSGALPALEELGLVGTPASAAATDAVSEALAKRK